MGKSLNKVQIIGHIGQNPEIKFLESGTAMTTFNIATNARRKVPNSDEWQEETEWHRAVAWGKLAEIAGEYLAKGRQVYIEGHLQTRAWEDQNSVKRYTTEIVVDELIFIGKKEDENGTT